MYSYYKRPWPFGQMSATSDRAICVLRGPDWNRSRVCTLTLKFFTIIDWQKCGVWVASWKRVALVSFSAKSIIRVGQRRRRGFDVVVTWRKGATMRMDEPPLEWCIGQIIQDQIATTHQQYNQTIFLHEAILISDYATAERANSPNEFFLVLRSRRKNIRRCSRETYELWMSCSSTSYEFDWLCVSVVEDGSAFGFYGRCEFKGGGGWSMSCLIIKVCAYVWKSIWKFLVNF